MKKDEFVEIEPNRQLYENLFFLYLFFFLWTSVGPPSVPGIKYPRVALLGCWAVHTVGVQK